MGAIDRFLGQCRADPELAPCAADLSNALGALDLEGDGNREAVALFDAVLWVIKQSCAADERLRALHRLFSLPRGPTRVTLRRRGDSIVVERIS
jgi:hypothetical protein